MARYVRRPGRYQSPDLYAVDHGKVKEVHVVERGFYGPPKELTPGVSLLVRDKWTDRVMRLDMKHLFRTKADAEAAIKEGITGWMPEPRYRHKKRKPQEVTA